MPSQTFSLSNGRRTFIATITKATGAALFLASPLASLAGSVKGVQKVWTVGEIMDLFIAAVPGAPFTNTVDTLKAGSRDTQVSGIVTSMFATVEVVQKAIAAGANFIIAHEPTFYNHADDTEWLQHDAVYNYKRDLLQRHNIAVWRNHDYVHSYVPDGVQTAVVKKLGWTAYQDEKMRSRITLPATSLQGLISHVKKSLGIRAVRYIGTLSQSCKKVLLMPGAYGGKRQIEAISREQPDVVIVGEIQEWETAEYVRDARAKGQPLSLIVLGHIDSEEPGSAFMAQWLQQHVPGVKITHVPAQNALSCL